MGVSFPEHDAKVLIKVGVMEAEVVVVMDWKMVEVAIVEMELIIRG